MDEEGFLWTLLGIFLGSALTCLIHGAAGAYASCEAPHYNTYGFAVPEESLEEYQQYALALVRAFEPAGPDRLAQIEALELIAFRAFAQPVAQEPSETEILAEALARTLAGDTGPTALEETR